MFDDTRFWYIYFSEGCFAGNTIGGSLPDRLDYIGIDFFTWYVLLYCIHLRDNLISSTGALCYAEIGTIIPRNGAEVVYMKEGMLTENEMVAPTTDFKIGIGSVHARTGDILAYLYVWTSTFIIKPATVTVLSLIFSQYFLSGIMGSK